MSQSLAALNPQPNDLLVIPEDMEVASEIPCSVYRMKYLRQPAIIRSGGYSVMSFLDEIHHTTLARWLGLDHVIGREPRDTVPAHVPMTELNKIYKIEPPEVKTVAPVAAAAPAEAKTYVDKFYSYVRNHEWVEHPKGKVMVVSPRGGLTFYVELDSATNSFAFSYAICHINDNFNKATARAICKGRFNADDWYEIVNYDSKETIQTNIELALNRLLHDKKNEDTIAPHFSSLSPKMKLYELKQIYERI